MASPSVLALLEHTGFVRNLARGALGREDGSEDVAQDAWVAALESGPREPAAARGWLARVVRNRVVSLGRRETIQRRGLREVSPRPDVPSPREILEREEARRRLVEALTRLDAIYREPLVLRYYEDLPPRKIAKRLGVPVETVRTRLRRGVEHLRDALDAGHGGRREWVVALLPLARLPKGGVLPRAGKGAPAAPVAAGVALAIGAGATALVALRSPSPAVGPAAEAAATTVPAERSWTDSPLLHGREGAASPGAAARSVPPSRAADARVGVVRVLDAAGEAIPGARVRISEPRRAPGSGHARDRVALERTTGPDGRASFPRPGAPDPSDPSATKFRLLVTPPAERGGVEEVEILDWTLEDLVVTLGRGVTVDGEVVDQGGRPVRGATVHLVSSRRTVDVPVDLDGRFSRAGLAATSWRASASVPGLRAHLRGDEVAVDEKTGRARLVIDVEASLHVTLAGHARSDGNVPLSVTVDSDPAGATATRVVDVPDDGTASIYGLTPSSRVAVWWGPDAAGRTAYAAGLRPDGGTTSVPIRPGGRLSVEVRPPEGWTGSTAVWVSAPGLRRFGVWAPNGDAVFDGLPDVELVVDAAGTDADRREARGEVRARPGERAVVAMSLVSPPAPAAEADGSNPRR